MAEISASVPRPTAGATVGTFVCADSVQESEVLTLKGLKLRSDVVIVEFDIL